MTQTYLGFSFLKMIGRFGILKLGTRPQGGESKRSADNFGHCYLGFVICNFHASICNLKFLNPSILSFLNSQKRLYPCVPAHNLVSLNYYLSLPHQLDASPARKEE